jgi:Icc protein
VPGKVQGELSLESLEWLDDQLQLTAATPTLIGLHHPPLLVGSKWLDTSALQNPENFFAVIDRYPQVKLVIFGHIHQEFECQRRGVYYLSAPSTCIQFAPHSQDFSLDRAQPGFRLFALYPDGRFETKVERVNFSYQLDLSVRGY